MPLGFSFVKCLFCVLLTRLSEAFFFFFPWPSLPVLLGGAPSAWRCKSLHAFAPLKVTAAADLWREGGTFPDPSDPDDLDELLNDICRFSLRNGDGVHSSGRSLLLCRVPSCGSSRCHCRHGFEAAATSRGCGSPERHPAPFIGHIVSQMFRMHGPLSARMFDGLAAKGDIW